MSAPAPSTPPRTLQAVPDQRRGSDGPPEDDSRLGIGARTRRRAAALAGDAPYWLAWLIRKTPRWVWYALRDLLVGLVRVTIACWAWLHFAEERAAARKMESKDAKAKALREINKDARFRLISTGVVAGIVGLGHLVLYVGWPLVWELLIAAELLGSIGLCEYVGHRPVAKEEPVRRRGPLTHGTSSRTLRRDLEEAFAVKKIPDVGVLGLTVNKFGWHGVIETEAKITDDLIEHIERWVHAPSGALMVAEDPRNAAARPFKLLVEDPLAQPSVPDTADRLDVRQPQNIGRHLFGRALMVSLLQHIGLIGRSGSGKSSGLWTLVDRIARCYNAEVDGIDLTGGPAFPVWRRVIRRRGTTPGEAMSILEEAIALAEHRIAELARLAESEEDADIEENWEPKDGVDQAGYSRRARFIAIDEFHVLAVDKELLEKVTLIARIGRKACVFLILASPGASKEDLGSTIIKATVSMKIIFACVIQDVVNFLGGGYADLGWKPYKLRPAIKDDPRDAGKAFIWSGAHQDPEVVRIARLSANDCRDRARAHGRLTAPVEVPRDPALQVLDAAFEHYGRDSIPTRWLDQFLTDGDSTYTLDGLQAALRAQGVTTRQLGTGPWQEKNPRGYTR